MGLNFYYFDGLQPKIRAGIINEHECKKEPKSDDRLSKFDWHDLSQFLGQSASLQCKSILEINKTPFASYSTIQ